MRLRDTLERLVWTVVQASLSSLASVSLFGISAWQAAGVAGLTAAFGFLSLVARARLAVLPNPGEGLPGLPTRDPEAGYTDVLGLVVMLLLILVLLRVLGLI